MCVHLRYLCVCVCSCLGIMSTIVHLCVLCVKHVSFLVDVYIHICVRLCVFVCVTAWSINTCAIV